MGKRTSQSLRVTVVMIRARQRQQNQHGKSSTTICLFSKTTTPRGLVSISKRAAAPEVFLSEGSRLRRLSNLPLSFPEVTFPEVSFPPRERRRFLWRTTTSTTTGSSSEYEDLSSEVRGRSRFHQEKL